MSETALIVIGNLHTDIIAQGVTHLPGPGELVWGKQALIGPGGKSRNIAAMAASVLPADTVAMIGHTVKDSFGLWKVPVKALRIAGVNTDYITAAEARSLDDLPALTLIPVDEQGRSSITVLPGAAQGFNSGDVDAADVLFQTVARNHGFLVLTLECNQETLDYAVHKARQLGIRLLCDPGGIESAAQLTKILTAGVFLLKPNEHEAETIAGFPVTDFASAQKAAKLMQQQGAQHVLITHGEHGAYLFNESVAIPIPVTLVEASVAKDSTGCGDQTMAVLCALLQEGKSLEVAARTAVAAGTLQFQRLGIQPISREEVEALLQ